MATSQGSGRWRLPFLSALVAALLAVVINMSTDLVPDSWTWAHDPVLMWPLLVVLAVVSAALAAAPSGSSGSDPAATDDPRARPAILPGPGTTITVAPGEPSTTRRRMVHGEIPARPPAWQDRPEVTALVAAVRDRTGVTTVCATGQRGVGKTQAAAAVARHMVDLEWPLVVWVSGESEQDLVAGLAPVARELGVHDPDGDSYRSAERLRDHLQTRTEPGLVVIDNAENAESVQRWIPTAGPTRVVVTSTNQELAGLGARLEIGTYPRERSVAYLEASTHIADPDGADRVADDLGDLPLALAQAASTIRDTDRTYASYLARLADTDVDAALTRHHGDAYPRGSAAAILLSLQAVESKQPTARQVLEVVALCDPAGVERDLLAAVVDDRPTAATGGVQDRPVARAVGRAVTMSVLTWAEGGGRSVGEQSLVMHRLVARVVRERAVRDGTMPAAVRRALDGLGRQLAEPADGVRRRDDALDEAAGHARSLWHHLRHEAAQHAVDETALAHGADLVATTVGYLDATAQHRAAIALGEGTLEQIRNLLGGDHPAALRAANNLASAYLRSEERVADAVRLHKDTFDRRLRLLEKEHPDTLVSMNNLASAYDLDGQVERSLPLCLAIHAHYSGRSGDTHIDTLRAAHTLAYAHKRVGDLDRALELYDDTLARHQELVGGADAEVLRLEHNRAMAHRQAGRPGWLATLAQTLRRHREVLGDDHPDTLRVADSLGTSLRDVGRRAEARSLLEDTLARSRGVLGADHPDTRRVDQHLGTVRRRWPGFPR